MTIDTDWQFKAEHWENEAKRLIAENSLLKTELLLAEGGSSRSAEAGKPVVKGLEWEESKFKVTSQTPFGSYMVYDYGGNCSSLEQRYGLNLPLPAGTDGRRFPSIEAAKAAAQADYEARILSALSTPADIEPVSVPDGDRKFALGDLVTKTKGSSWTGRVVGFYSTNLTPIGYAVESETETGSVQIYPGSALAAAPQPNQSKVDAEAWGKLCKLTFAVQHNPNCASPWLVRLPGKGPIDMKPYGDPLGLVRHQTGDILGFGKTLSDAARAALAAQGEKP